MRILHFCALEPGPMVDWQRFHISAELTDAGHDVVFLNPVETLGASGTLEDFSQVTLDAVKAMIEAGGCDLFFATATDLSLTGDAVDEIKRLGVPTVNLAPDVMSHPYRVRRLSKHFDLTWSLVREANATLESYGARLIVMPLAANPNLFRPTDAVQERAVGFIGSCYGARARALGVIAEAGIPAVLFGRRPEQYYSDVGVNNPAARALFNTGDAWRRLYESLQFSHGRICVAAALKRSALELVSSGPERSPKIEMVAQRPGVSFEELGACVSALAMTLGSIDLASTYVLKNPLYVIRLREFEMAMCGAAHLVNRFPELGEYFEEDKEMLYYGSMEEMVDKLRFYLDPARDGQRNEIRRRARARAESDHTWMKRFARIGEAFGLKF